MYGCTDVRNVQDVYRGILWLHLVYSAKDASWTVLGGSSRNLSWGTPTSSDTDYICVRWEFSVVSSSLIFMRLGVPAIKFGKIQLLHSLDKSIHETS